MAETKVQLVIGDIQFIAEGDAKWLETQMDKLIAVAVTHPSASQRRHKDQGATAESHAKGTHTNQTLAAFLREKNATTNQVRKFLATAIWLQDSRQVKRLKTGDVAKALAEAQQNRLGNPSDTLNKNIAKGHCEKQGSEFFVTTEGRGEIGVD